MTVHLSAAEAGIVRRIGEGRGELVDLVRQLVAYDTCYRPPGVPAAREAHLQKFLQRRLGALGADTELWEPEPTGEGNLLVPDNLEFSGRPQLVARLAGSGQGQSLLLLGHVDCVPAEPIHAWTSDPLVAEVRNGRIYGRGVADMKGGVASLLFALETLSKLGMRLAGDVVFCSVTDEESSGAGSLSAVRHGVRADAGLCAENTGFAIWTACRGSVVFDVDVHGRAGHAEIMQRHWKEGGAVNAIDKATLILTGLKSLGDEWRTRADHRHPLLPPGKVVTVGIAGGEWEASVPSRCRITANAQFLPRHVDGSGDIPSVRNEVEDALRQMAATDSWLVDHPPETHWHHHVLPAETGEELPLVTLISESAGKVGREARVAGLDSWHDPANFIQLGRTPTVSFGPGDLEASHTADEWLDIDALVDHCAAVALTVLHFCS